MAKIWVAKYENQADAKICEVAYESQADLCWHETEHKEQAHGDAAWYFVDVERDATFKVFKIKYTAQADIRVFKVKYPEQAGWRKVPHKFSGRLD